MHSNASEMLGKLHWERFMLYNLKGYSVNTESLQGQHPQELQQQSVPKKAQGFAQQRGIAHYASYSVHAMCYFRSILNRVSSVGEFCAATGRKGTTMQVFIF